MRKLFDLICGVWGALCLAALSFIDIPAALTALGMDTGYISAVTPEQRRAIFLALAFLWMFVWYWRTRSHYEDAHQEPTMPLHLVCRWIARDSKWAAAYVPTMDDQWPLQVRSELASKIRQGRIEPFGVPTPRGRASESATSPFIPAFKESMEWEAGKLALSEAPTYMWSTDHFCPVETYEAVKFDERRVRQLWPRKSAVARIRKKSPVQRCGGYKLQFKSQDGQYAQTLGATIHRTLESFFNEPDKGNG